MSNRMVVRCLQEYDINGRVVVRNPLTHVANIAKRYAWAKKHKDWSKEQWKKVLKPTNQNLNFLAHITGLLCIVIQVSIFSQNV